VSVLRRSVEAAANVRRRVQNPHRPSRSIRGARVSDVRPAWYRRTRSVRNAWSGTRSAQDENASGRAL